MCVESVPGQVGACARGLRPAPFLCSETTVPQKMSYSLVGPPLATSPAHVHTGFGVLDSSAPRVRVARDVVRKHRLPEGDPDGQADAPPPPVQAAHGRSAY